MPTEVAVLAYAAGVFDGEGCVLVRLNKKKGQEVAKYHQIAVSVVSTDTKLTDWFQGHFGGKISANHKENAQRNYKDAWKWGLMSRQAEAFLKCVRPYLLVKGPQADVALELQSLMGLGGATVVTETMFGQRESLRLRMKTLNRRGRAPIEED